MAGLRLSYSNPRLLRTLHIQLQQQQQAGLFCDVTLQGDGEGVDVHSCVIAACSPYLANLLMSPTEISEVSDSTRHVLKIRGVKSLHLFPLVQYMYTSELKVAPGDVSGVLQAAQKLQIPEVELLKLEAGRLVRTESGRRLNRSCLGSKTRTHYAKADKRAKAENQGTINPCAHIPMKPTRNGQNKMESDVDNLSLRDIDRGNENTPDMETSSCGASEIGSSDLGCLENVLSSGSSVEDFVGDHGDLENVPSSRDFMPYVLGKQNSQEDAPLSRNSIEDIAKSRDLIDNPLIIQDFMQDVISNQNSPTARSLDLMESKLKGSLDYGPSGQDLSEQTVHDNVQSIKELSEDVQSIEEFLENIQSSEELLENMQNMGKLPETVQSSHTLPENGPRGEDTQENLLKRCRTTPPKQSRSNPEVIEMRYHTTSRKGLLKRIKLERKGEELASRVGFLKIKLPGVNCSNIDVSDEKQNAFNLSSTEDVLGDHQVLEQCDKPQGHHWNHLKHTAEVKEQLPDESETPEHAGRLGRLKVCQLRTEKNVFYKDGRAIGSNEITDPPVIDVNGNNSVPHNISESLKESWSGLMTEMKTGTVDHKGLTSSAQCGSEINRIVDHEGSALSTYCESETSGTVGQDGLMTSTYYGSETSGPGNQEGLPSGTHCKSETSGTVGQDGLMTSTYYGSETSGTGNREGLPSGTHCKSETSGTVGQDGLMTSTYYGSETSGTGNQEGLPSGTHCKSETSGTVGQDGLRTSTYYGSETSGTGNQEGLPSGTHCKSETSGTVGQDGLRTSTYYGSETSGTGNQEGLRSGTHCKSETSGTVGQDGLMTSTYYGSETSGTGNQEGLPSGTHCKSETSGTVGQDGLRTSTYNKSETSGTGNQEGLPSGTHCKSETSGTVGQDGLRTSTYNKSETSGTENQEGLPSGTHCKSEASGTLDQDGLMTSTYYGSETNGTENQEGLPSGTHCKSETSGTVGQDGLRTSTYNKSETSGTGNQEGLPSSTHCKFEANQTVDQEDVSGMYCKSETDGIVDHECLTSSAHYESETSGTVGQVGLTSGTRYESKIRLNQEGLPSSAHREFEIFSSTYCKSETDGIVDHDESLDEFQKRRYVLDDSFENEVEKVKMRKTNDALSWEVESLNGTCPSQGKEHFKELEEQVEQILNFTTPMSPDVDVGVYSPPVFMEERLWPDLSSDSDMEIDVLG